MHQHESLLMLVSGGRRYAVPRRVVRALTRNDTSESMMTLAECFGEMPLAEEPYAITVAGPSGNQVVHVQQADLTGSLPQLALPDWLAQQVHPAVIGLVLDDVSLIPLVDLSQLALETGYGAT